MNPFADFPELKDEPPHSEGSIGITGIRKTEGQKARADIKKWLEDMRENDPDKFLKHLEREKNYQDELHINLY